AVQVSFPRPAGSLPPIVRNATSDHRLRTGSKLRARENETFCDPALAEVYPFVAAIRIRAAPPATGPRASGVRAARRVIVERSLEIRDSLTKDRPERSFPPIDTDGRSGEIRTRKSVIPSAF
ncbi:MAG: hypothetical protein ACREQ9_14585, partial [Candidatus Binatia bacterium]